MKIILCLFVVVAIIATGDALRCYQCGITNPKCTDFDKDKVAQQDCRQGHDSCAKYTAILSNGTTVITRGCDFKFIATRAAEVTVDTTSTVYCYTDLCNGVSSTSAALTTLMVLIAPLIFTN